MAPLKLCILSSEIVPYAKTGGLADVAGALLQNLGAIGHTVRALMPRYPVVRSNYPSLKAVRGVQRVALPIGDTDYSFSLLTANYPNSHTPMDLVCFRARFSRG